MLSQGGFFEEAQLLRAHELELKQKLTGPTKVPLVTVADMEAVVSAWSGVPVQQMNAEEMLRLNQLEPTLKVGPVPHGALAPQICCLLHTCAYIGPELQLLYAGLGMQAVA